MAAKDDVESEVLAGCPYSLPHDAADQLERLSAVTETIRDQVATASNEARERGLFEQVMVSQRQREVYESNALELEGPDLAATVEVLESTLATDMDRTLREQLLPQLLAEDPDIHAVIGLEAARLLANRLLITLDDRSLSETDVRSMHGLLTAGHDYAGQYKRFHVLLGGNSEHEPVLPIEVPAHMHNLVSWNAECSAGNPILRAAALHAWLTHIHPFEDGNGRIARLLANMTLARAGLPPAIVKARTQRGDYLDALATSDQGGDIMPLTGLFSRTLTRFAADMQKPRFFRKLFAELIARRGSREFDWFSAELTSFLRMLSAELSTYRIASRPWGEIDSEDFEVYRARRSNEATTVLMIESEDGAQVAVQVAAPSSEVARFAQADEMWPSIRFAVRSRRFQLDAYSRADPWRLHGMREIYFDLDTTPKAYAFLGRRTLHGETAKIAEIAANQINLGLTSGRVHQRSAGGYWPALPKVDGGPG